MPAAASSAATASRAVASRAGDTRNITGGGVVSLRSGGCVFAASLAATRRCTLRTGHGAVVFRRPTVTVAGRSAIRLTLEVATQRSSRQVPRAAYVTVCDPPWVTRVMRGVPSCVSGARSCPMWTAGSPRARLAARETYELDAGARRIAKRHRDARDLRKALLPDRVLHDDGHDVPAPREGVEP